MNQQYDRNLAQRNEIVPASTQSSLERCNLLKKSKEVILYAGSPKLCLEIV